MDRDGDGLISLADWTESLSSVCAASTAGDFDRAICAILHGATLPYDVDPVKTLPRYPISNQQYLKDTVYQVLKHGIAEVIEYMAQQHIMVASQQLWDSDGHLPKGYVPPNPIRILGQWLKDYSKQTLEDDIQAADWSSGVPWKCLTFRMKLRAVFGHLDRPPTGCALGGGDLFS
jgi:hypothetical protein